MFANCTAIHDGENKKKSQQILSTNYFPIELKTVMKENVTKGSSPMRGEYHSNLHMKYLIELFLL